MGLTFKPTINGNVKSLIKVTILYFIGQRHALKLNLTLCKVWNIMQPYTAMYELKCYE